MIRRKYEKPQKGNPHKLPIKQHVFPSASIERFADTDGMVNLHLFSHNLIRKAKPSDDVFCVMRAWDAKAEFGYMKQIEDKFQSLAIRIIKKEIIKINAPEKYVIDQFFGLWKWRAVFRAKEMDDIKFNGVTGEEFTKDQEEVLEKKGILFARQGGVMSAHRLHGTQIQGGIMHEMYALSNVRWVISYAQDGQFIIPDYPNITFIPIHPTLCLCGTTSDIIDNGVMTKSAVIKLNRDVRTKCEKYYFANDLQKCFLPSSQTTLAPYGNSR
jgi:hypothetical protein